MPTKGSATAPAINSGRKSRALANNAAPTPMLIHHGWRDRTPKSESFLTILKCASAKRSTDYMSDAALPPLKGIKVIELGTLIAGPFCTRILGEFGAEVIKIEAPDGGDQLRGWRKMYEGTSLWWYVQARNKKSVTVNLRDPEGQEIVRKLAAEADIVVENF